MVRFHVHASSCPVNLAVPGRILTAVTTFVVAMPVLYAMAAGLLAFLRSTGRPVLSDETLALVYHPLIRV